MKDLTKLTDQELLDKLKETTTSAEYAESLSLAFKIRINSYYGSNALIHNPYSNGRVTGGSIAMSTRAVNKSQALACNKVIAEELGEPQDTSLRYSVQVDTDSSYNTLEKVIDKYQPDDKIEFCKKFSMEKMYPEIKKNMKKLFNALNTVHDDIMSIDNEIIAEDFISIAPKRYFAKVVVADGVTLTKPKLKATGISLISRSTPKGVKDILKPTLNIFLEENNEGLRKYLNNQLLHFSKLSPKDMGGAVGLTSLNYTPFFDKVPVEDWKKADRFKRYDSEKNKFLTAPINSKGSLVHNFLITENNLLGKYELIEESNKINVIYLTVPNPITFNHNVIAFKDEQVLKDLGLLPYIDKEKQWNKEVIDKVKIIANTINWNVEDKADSLDEW